MKYMVVLALLFSGCAASKEYRCPPSQVMVIEDRGLASERQVCYVPGISYTDYRPITTEVVK